MSTRAKIVLLGTGSSTSVPYLRCLLDHAATCTVCVEAAANAHSKNRRNNPCCLLQLETSEGHRNVLLDCGKTFRDSAVRFFKEHRVRCIDTIILTHEHADAILGLDDLRDVQHDETCTDVYCSAKSEKRLHNIFPYLLVPPNKDAPLRYMARLKAKVFVDDIRSDGAPLEQEAVSLPPPFVLAGVCVQPLPVWHGIDYLSFGFHFALPFGHFVYISDLSALMPATEEYLLQLTIEVFVIDAVFVEREHPTHVNMPQALEIIRRLRPRRSVLLGMTHEFDYDTHSKGLAEFSSREGLSVYMGYDGMVLHDDFTAAEQQPEGQGAERRAGEGE